MVAQTLCAVGSNSGVAHVARCARCTGSLGVPYQIDDASPFCRDPIELPVICSLSSLREMDMEEASLSIYIYIRIIICG